MKAAERLDLITNVRDQFSDDLLMLSAQLETAGRLADKLSPIRIRVSTHDRQLDETLSKVGTLKGLDSTQTFNIRRQGAVAEGMGRLFGDSEGFNFDDTFDTTATDLLEDSFQSVTESAQEVSENLENELGSEGFSEQYESVTAIQIGTVGSIITGSELSQIIGNVGAGGRGGSATAVADGGRGDGGVSREMVNQVRDQFGVNVTNKRFLREGVGPMDFLADEAIPFQISESEITEGFSQQAFRRALDMDGVADQLISDRRYTDINRQTDLLGRNLGGINTLLKHSNGEFNSLNDAVNRSTLKWQQFKQGFLDIRIGMTQFYDFLAALMPLMFVLIGSLPAVIGALSGLGAAAIGAAGGLAAIAGLGLMGAAGREAGGDRPGFEELQEVLSDIPDDFFQAFRGVAQRLEPEFERMMGGLSSMFDDLAYRLNRVLTETGLREMGRDFGRWLIPFIGETTEGLLRMADATRGVFGMMAQGLGDRDILAGLAFSLANALPYLANLTGLLMDAMPGIVRFSTGMLHMANFIASVVSQIGRLGDIITRLSGGLIDGHQALGMMTAGFFTLMSAVFLTSKVATIFETRLWSLTGAKLKTMLISTKWIGTLHKKVIAMKLAGGAAWGLAFAISAVAKAIAAVLAVSVIGAVLMGLSAGVTALADHFFDLTGNVNDATDALQEFDRQQQSMAGHDGVYTGSLDRTTYVDVTDNSQTTITGSSQSMTSDAEYANFLDQDRQDQLFS